MRRKLSARLDRHFLAFSASAIVSMGGSAQRAHASIVYSGTVNIPIPSTVYGVYLNVVTGATGANPPAWWDINPYYGGARFWNGAVSYATVASGNLISVLAPGTLIDGANCTNTTAIDGSAFPATAPGGLYGFRFRNESTGGTDYGGARIIRSTLPTSGSGTIVEYGYEDSGGAVAAGVIPSPGSIVLVGLCAHAALRRRR